MRPASLRFHIAIAIGITLKRADNVGAQGNYLDALFTGMVRQCVKKAPRHALAPELGLGMGVIGIECAFARIVGYFPHQFPIRGNGEKPA